MNRLIDVTLGCACGFMFGMMYAVHCIRNYHKACTTKSEEKEPSKTNIVMKGYLTKFGYFGWVGDRYLLFSTEAEYQEYMEERNNER